MVNHLINRFLFFFFSNLVLALIISATVKLAVAGSELSAEINFCQQPDNQWRDKDPIKYAENTNPLNWMPRDDSITQPTASQLLCGGFYQPFASIGLDANPVSGNLYAAADRYTMTQSGEGELCGNVILQQDDLQMSSDYVKINMANSMTTHPNQEKFAEFFGRVRLLNSEALIVGNHALTNLNTEIVSLDYPFFLLTTTQARGSAEKITLMGKAHTLIDRGSYTTCPPQRNDWQLRGQHFKLNHESGWGEVRHMRLEAAKVPIFYMPYFRFPTDSRRHTGFLYPEINNLAQPDIGLPFYWNIHPQLDLVTTPRQIGNRGVMLENTVRYLANSSNTGNSGSLLATYLPSDDLAKNNNRSRFSWQHNSHINHMIFAHIDLNSVSDNAYFDDFGTDLAANQTSYLNRQITLTYLQDNWNAEMQVDSPEVIDNAIAASNKPYQKLPELTVSQQSLLADRVDWFNSASYGYFSQPDAPEIIYGHRLHLNTQLQLPLTTLWGYIKPSLRIQNTDYQLEPRNNQDIHLSRTLPTYSLDAGLFFEKTLDNQYTQTLEPRLFYTHTPYSDQRKLPNFDTTDLTFSWEQLFRDNRFSGVDRIGDTQQTTLAISSQILDDNLHTLGRFTVGQIFYHQSQQVILNDSSNSSLSNPLQLNIADPDDDQRYSPLVAIAEWRLNDKLSSQNGITWNTQDNQISEGFTGLRYSPAAQHHWNVAYRYQAANAIEQIDLSTQYPLSLHWQLLTRLNVDLQERRVLEQISGLQYDSCCWQTTFAYHRWIKSSDLLSDASENDYAFLVQFYFKGLGKVGSKLNDVLSRSIPGYRGASERP